MFRDELRWKTADGLRIYAQTWEPVATPIGVVCLVHGLGEHTRRYAHVVPAFCAAGYALLGFDLRGHGKSEGPRGHAPSYDSLMDDIGLLLEQATARYPEQARFLWGHSLGGGLVLNYALRRRPDLQGVIATSPWLDLAFSPSWAKVAVGRIAARVWPSLSMANALDTQALCHDPQVVREYLRDPLVHDRISAQLGISMLDAGKWALAHAREFSLPLLLVHGGVDRITSARATREFASRVPRGCTLKLWEGLYHETHNEPQKNEVLSHIVDWIKTHTSRDDRAPGNGRARWDVAGPDLTGSSWQRKETI